MCFLPVIHLFTAKVPWHLILLAILNDMIWPVEMYKKSSIAKESVTK